MVRLGLFVQCLCIGFEFLLAGKRAGVLGRLVRVAVGPLVGQEGGRR